MSDPRARLRTLENKSATYGNAMPKRLEVPHIAEFATGAKYLNRALYPNQLLLLKIIFLEEELLTPYDRSVIADWESGFELVEHGQYQCFEGQRGLAPGTIERMQACRATGRSWFREAVLVFGRRAGKNYLGAIIVAYQLWRVLAMNNPQRALGMEQTKDLLFLTLAGDLKQANANAFRDLANLLQDAPCFRPFLGKRGATSLKLRTPHELGKDTRAAGSIVIEARPATHNSGRGAATMSFIYDEMSHAAAPGLQRGADEVYRGVVPSLAQFQQDSLCLLISSPASQIGEFYAADLRALAAVGGRPADPTTIAIQLPTWVPYENWELTREGLPMWPGGPNFAPLEKAIVTEQDLERQARDDPDLHKVEHLAQWRTSASAYLTAAQVHAIFEPYEGRRLSIQARAVPGRTYVMACDPSFVGANFGVAIGHIELDSSNDEHVVYDYLDAFRPKDFDNGEINYQDVAEQLKVLIDAFRPESVVFDQFESVFLGQALQQWAQSRFGFAVKVIRNPASSQSNIKEAERFKNLAIDRRVHAPFHELAREELSFLQRIGTRIDHPDAGPVRTSDITDAMFAVAARLTDGSAGVHGRLAEVRLSGAPARGIRPAAFDQFYQGRRRDRRPASPARGLSGRQPYR